MENEIHVCAYCGASAKHQLKNGNWCCNNSINKCPSIKKKHSDGLKRRHRECKWYKPGYTVWNKGLTKDTSEVVRRGAESLRTFYKTHNGTFRDKHHSVETKMKLSEIGRNSLYQRKCKKTVPYLTKNGSIVNLDSSWERFVAEFLDRNNITWERPGPIPWIDLCGTKHNYFPDFYLVDYGIYLDPKNDYCFEAQKEKIDYISAHYRNVIFLKSTQLNESELFKILNTTVKTPFGEVR